MARFKHNQTSFIAGRVASRMRARLDLDTYVKAAEEIKNKIVFPQGGVSRRPGTEYIKQSKHPQSTTTRKSRIIPFIFSNEEAYAVVIYSWEAGLTSFGTTSGIEVINITSKKTSHLLGPQFGNVAVSFDNGNSSFYGNGGATEAVFTPNASELDEIQYAQNADLLVLVHPKFNPVYIVRTGQDIFTLRHYQATADGKRVPFQDINVDSGKLMSTTANAGNGVTINTNFDFFHGGHKGAILRLDDLTNPSGFICITSILSTKKALGDVITQIPAGAVDAGGNPLVSTWYESAWSDFSGWPRTVCFFQRRLVFGGNKNDPNGIWFSRLNNIEEMMSVVSQGGTASDETDPFTMFLASNTVDSIQWMAPGKTLVIGTGSNEFVVESPDSTQALNKGAQQATVQTSHGSEYVRPIRLEDAVMFVTKGWEKVREFNFNLVEDRYTTNYLNIMSDDISRIGQTDHTSFVPAKIKSLQYQEARNGVIWGIDSNGGLFGCTRDRVNSVNAWHTHYMGGVGNSSSEKPFVESIAVIPSENGNFDDIWMCVRRYINGAIFYSIERMLQDYELPTIKNTSSDIRDKPIYSDAASFQRQGSTNTVFGGLEHLVGESVAILADSKWVGSKTVASGAEYITNPGAESDISGWTHFSDIKNFISGGGGVAVAAPGINTTTDLIWLASHGFREGQRITYSSGTPFSANGADVTGGTGSAIFYVRNPTTDSFQLSFEVDFPILDITADAAGTHLFTPRYEPSNGNGGAGPLTFRRNTATPIVGSASFELVKDATFRAGVGISTDFTINAEDKGKRIRVSFLYSITGGISNTTLSVCVYDKTNNILLIPEYFKLNDTLAAPNIYDRVANSANLNKNGNGSSQFECDFKTNLTSSSYRLIIMINLNNNATAGSYLFDSFSIRGSGTVTLDSSATEIVAGLNYTSYVKLLDIEGGSQLGSAQGSRKRINEITLRLHNTIGGRFGRDSTNLQNIVMDTQNEVPDNPIELFTGDKTYEFRGNNERQAKIYVEQNLPLPMTLLSVIARGDTHD